MSTRHVQQQHAARRVGMSPPAAAIDALWGSVLAPPAEPGAGVEARLRRAWKHTNGGYLTTEKDDPLWEQL